MAGEYLNVLREISMLPHKHSGICDDLEFRQWTAPLSRNVDWKPEQIGPNGILTVRRDTLRQTLSQLTNGEVRCATSSCCYGDANIPQSTGEGMQLVNAVR